MKMSFYSFLKSIFSALVVVLIFSGKTVHAQAPEKMSYQAVIRNSSNALVINQSVGMRLSILQGTSNGMPVYTETHSATTNSNGLVSIEAGSGNVVFGVFANIDWANGPFFLKTETDPNGGTNYTISGTTQLLSVPYALHAKSSTSALNGIPSGWSEGQILSICNGVPCWIDCGTCNAVVVSLGCGMTSIEGNLIANTPASNVTATIPYNGGNGGTVHGQSVQSTGVLGLTATLEPGMLNTGLGTLVFTITGTPTSAGTATFAVSFGGSSCIISIDVTIADPNFPPGTVNCGVITQIVDVLNPATGRTWMDRNLGASQAATSSTDALSFGEYYQWGRPADGHQCMDSPTTTALSSVDQPNHGDFILVSSVSPNDWRNPQNNNLWQGLNGINNPCPQGYRLPTEIEVIQEMNSWQTQNAAGAFGSPLKLPMSGARNFTNGSYMEPGTYGNIWTSTVSGTFVKDLGFFSSGAATGSELRAYGQTIRCIKELETPVEEGSINSIDCLNPLIGGTLTENVEAESVSVTINYEGGNGGAYDEQEINSTGVTGLTALVTSGNFENGAGSLVFFISGTPVGSGIAYFEVTIGGQTCTFEIMVEAAQVEPEYPVGTVHCGVPTEIVDVLNPATGRIWMDRNLGASQVATSSTDNLAHGEYYQWGRPADGHQCANSPTTSTLSSVDQPNHGDFILVSTGSPNDWRDVKNDNLWQGVNGINNPCPAGYRIPTQAEWVAERNSWSSQNATGAISSPLKLSMTGARLWNDGTMLAVGSFGNYWSSTVDGDRARDLGFNNSTVITGPEWRATGQTVRCIKHMELGSLNTLDCENAVHNGTLTHSQNVNSFSNITSVVTYTSAVVGIIPGQVVVSTGVLGLTASYQESVSVNGNGTITIMITGTPSSVGTASFALNIGGQSCTLERTVNAIPAGQIGTINCNTATHVGVLTANAPATGVSSLITYSGGVFGSHAGQVVSSTGVTGLTASLSSGMISNGSGSFTYNITGTPSSPGVANFAINIGGQTCNLTRVVDEAADFPVGTVSCDGTPTLVVQILNPNTGKTWMDRNLGASNSSGSAFDVQGYGDLYQWGRPSDGHQCRTSPTSSTLSSVDQPNHGDFILSSSDWRTAQNDNLWQGVNGVNNPCPNGFRIPTSTELSNEINSWDPNFFMWDPILDDDFLYIDYVQGGTNSLLMWAPAGWRNGSNGSISDEGFTGSYWSSTISGTGSVSLDYNESFWNLEFNLRASGRSVRCIKN